MLPNIKKNADEGNVSSLHFIFSGSLDADPTFMKYQDGWNYCKQINGFIVPHEELTPFEKDSSKWNEDYWVKLKSDLIKNFSEERFEHMKNVAKYYYKDKIARLEYERSLSINEKVISSPVPSIKTEPNIIKSTNGIKDDAFKMTQAEREYQNAEKYAQEQMERDAKFEADVKKREEERREKRKEEAIKKIMGVAIVIVVILVVAVLLLLTK